ncbi:MAG: GNAT family N-acetyltransferase [Acidobacteria bacterium]|nr:GNAT family N-acetyltransferase [Acidobacteriota bacterium]MXZ71042.1 GNAT family N-acetyltransferase [Acidobacteriota bacterium]MYJ05707.1 GNAT family N-acetyltransferase [Acidobacteriota bacterium]
MQLDLGHCGVRSFRDADAAPIARHANNRKVWVQLRDQFPHPYTTDNAHGFIRFTLAQDRETAFAITVDDLPVGAIGVVLRDDVERCSAEIGYWLGEEYWGRGIATSALAGLTRFAFTAYDLERLYALPLASNAASCRVLEKAGYRLEGRLRRSAIKDGVVQDQLLYAILREEAGVGTAGRETGAPTRAPAGPTSGGGDADAR